MRAQLKLVRGTLTVKFPPRPDPDLADDTTALTGSVAGDADGLGAEDPASAAAAASAAAVYGDDGEQEPEKPKGQFEWMVWAVRAVWAVRVGPPAAVVSSREMTAERCAGSALPHTMTLAAVRCHYPASAVPAAPAAPAAPAVEPQARSMVPQARTARRSRSAPVVSQLSQSLPQAV